MLIITMPMKAQTIAATSKADIRSLIQKYPRRAVVKGLELKMMKNTLRGINFMAIANEANPTVPIRQRMPRVPYKLLGMLAK